MVRQLPQAAEYRWNSPRVHSSAAPMPRLGSVCDDRVWRVPKLTRLSIVCLSCAWLTGAMIARSFASGAAVLGAGGAAAIKARLLTAIN